MEQVKVNEEFRAKVIEEINFCRKDPQSYADKVRKYLGYFKGKTLRVPEMTPIMTTEGPSAFEEVAKYLDNLDAMDPLKYSPGLTHAAHDTMKQIQKFDDIDEIGELNIDEIISKHGEVFGIFAQACQFNSEFPEFVVIDLLVADGDSTRKSRESIINPKFKLIGVSTGSHSIYHNCTVVMYARKFYNLNEKPTYDSDSGEEKVAKNKTSSVPEKKNEITISSEKGLNVVRRSTLKNKDEVGEIARLLKEKAKVGGNNKTSTLVENPNANVKKSDEDDFDLPPGCLKLERQEKVVTENGITIKLVKLKKHMEDGTIETEIYKMNVK
jgi:hypothetical protein